MQPKWGNDAKKPLEIVHLGVCGPLRNTSVGGTKYFVTVIDGFFKEGVGLHDEMQRIIA